MSIAKSMNKDCVIHSVFLMFKILKMLSCIIVTFFWIVIGNKMKEEDSNMGRLNI